MPGNFKKQLIKTIISNAVEEILCLDSEDDDIDEILEYTDECLEIDESFRYGIQRNVPKNENWFAETLGSYDDDRFKGFLRVSRKQFNIILELIQENPVFNGKRSSLQHTVFFQLCVVLYRIGVSGEGASISRIASRFAIGDGSTLQRITARVFKAILDLKQTFLKWPDNEERKHIVEATVDELPHCVGYLDGSEIPLYEAPRLDPTSYFSRKKVYSIKLQAICDYSLKLRHIYVGYPGSVHDARIYTNSSIGMNPKPFLSEQQWIACDSAYKLTETSITPFRNPQNSRKIEFNKRFCKFRVRIENCFGLLKEKFNSLKCLRINVNDSNAHKFACSWITVCCILHNIILPHWDETDLESFYRNFEADDSNMDDDDIEFSNDTNVNKIAELKREAICSIILKEEKE